MKRIDIRCFAVAAVFASILTLSLSVQAQSADLYKSKCAMCHGADGRKVAGHDFSGPDVQSQSDADLAAVIIDGKAPKMPKFGDKLKPEEIKGLVAYIRTLKK